MMKTSAFSYKTCITLFIMIGFVFGATQTHAQAKYSDVQVDNGNLKGDLARCQKASVSTQNWLRIGTSIIQGAVLTAGGSNFRSNIAAGNQVGQQIAAQGIRELSSLVCGKACKDRQRKKATEAVGKLIGLKAAGSILERAVPTSDDALKEAIETGNEERKQDDAIRAAAVDNREVCVDALAQFGIQNALMALQAKTLDFINTGNGGAPFYLQDPESYFDTIYKDVLRKNINSNPKNATEREINNLIISQATGREPSAVGQGFAYLRDTRGVRTNTWDSFLQSSFQGGAMGQYLSTIDNINREYAGQRGFAEQEILRNRGFLDQKICAKYDKPNPDTNERRCLLYTTVTPGSVLADQVTSVFDSRFQSLANASGLSDAIALGFTSFTDSLLRRGLSNIGQNDRTYEYALGGANSGGQTNRNQFSSQFLNTSWGLASTPTNDYSNVTQDANGARIENNFDIAHTTTLAAVLRAQNTFLSLSKDSIGANRKLVAELGALDYCVPGPNPAWLSYTYQNQNTYNSAVQGGAGYQAFIADNHPDNFKNETFTTDRYGFDDPVTDSIVPYKSKIFKINPPHAPIKQSEKAGSGSAIVDYACGIGSAIINIFGGDTSCEKTKTWLEPDPTASNVVADAFTQWFAQYSQDMLEAYSTAKLTTAFSIADADMAAKERRPEATREFTKARVRAMVLKTNALVDYNQQLTENIQDYDESIDRATEVQAKMQRIYTDVLQIVAGARDRHIKTQLAQGVVVNQQCLDRNYSITADTAGVPQREIDADADATVIKSQFAKDTFYENLCGMIPGTNIPECVAPLVQSGMQYPFVAEIENLPECSSDTLVSDFNTAAPGGKVSVRIKSLTKIPSNYKVVVTRKVFADIYASEQNRNIDNGVPIPTLDLRYTMALSDSYGPKYIRGVLHEGTTKKIKTTTNIDGVGDSFWGKDDPAFANYPITFNLTLRTWVPGVGFTEDQNGPFASGYCDNDKNRDTYINAGMLPDSKNSTGDPILWTRRPFNPEVGAKTTIFRSLATDTGQQRSLTTPYSNITPVFKNVLTDGKVLWSNTALALGRSVTRNGNITSRVVSSKREYCTIGLNRTIGRKSFETDGGGNPNGTIFEGSLPAGSVIYDRGGISGMADALPALYSTTREYDTYREDAVDSRRGWGARTFAIFNHAVEVSIPRRLNYVIRVYNDAGGLVSTTNTAVSLDMFYLKDADEDAAQAGSLLRRVGGAQTIFESSKKISPNGVSADSQQKNSSVALCRK